MGGIWRWRIWGGEIWDANKEVNNWNYGNLNDRTWESATIYTPALKLSAQRVETNALFDEIQPISIETRNDGSYRVDMGVNFAGWTRIRLKGNPGDTISMLFPKGSRTI